MTLRHDFLYIEQGFEDGFEKRQISQKTAEAPALAASGSAAAAPCAPSDKSGGGTTSRVTAAKMPSTKRSAATAKMAAPAPLAKKAVKDALGSSTSQADLMKRVEKAKTVFLRESAEASNLIGCIQHSKEWSWARSADFLGVLTKASAAVDVFKNSSPFYMRLAFMPDFGKHARATFDEGTISKELGRVQEFEDVLTALTKTRDMILGVAVAKNVL